MNDTQGTPRDLELLQFSYSHFNEKVRWALDFKQIPHARTSLLPGPHLRRIRRLTGQTATPVLRIGKHYLAGSSDIILDLEHHYPDPALFPAEREANVLARELQRHFDHQLGPAARIVWFARMFGTGGYLPKMFSCGRSVGVRVAYRAGFPLLKPLMRKANGITDARAITKAETTLARNLDEIASLAEATGYLAGNEFSIADLTAAALMAPLLDVDHPDMRKPEPRPKVLQELTAAWSEHPAAVWGRRMYSMHRT